MNRIGRGLINRFAGQQQTGTGRIEGQRGSRLSELLHQGEIGGIAGESLKIRSRINSVSLRHDGDAGETSLYSRIGF